MTEELRKAKSLSCRIEVLKEAIYMIEKKGVEVVFSQIHNDDAE